MHPQHNVCCEIKNVIKKKNLKFQMFFQIFKIFHCVKDTQEKRGKRCFLGRSASWYCSYLIGLFICIASGLIVGM